MIPWHWTKPSSISAIPVEIIPSFAGIVVRNTKLCYKPVITNIFHKPCCLRWCICTWMVYWGCFRNCWLHHNCVNVCQICIGLYHHWGFVGSHEARVLWDHRCSSIRGPGCWAVSEGVGAPTVGGWWVPPLTDEVYRGISYGCWHTHTPWLLA